MLNKRVEILMDEETLNQLIALSKRWRRSRGYVLRALLMKEVRDEKTQFEDDDQGPYLRELDRR